MKHLTREQIEQIREDIRNGGINMPDLEEDLLDHFCCTIEVEMEQGNPFESAYLQAQREICPEGLGRIQEDTLSMLDRAQNKLVKRLLFSLGFLSAFTFLISSLFKIFQWPLANPLMMASSFLLFVGFLPVFILSQIRENRKKSWLEKSTYLLGTITTAAVSVGSFFKIMHWPGANIFILLGVSGFALIFLPLLFYSLYRRSDSESVAADL